MDNKIDNMWYFLSNNRNILNWRSSNLISAEGKHKDDTTNITSGSYKGFIPLFREQSLVEDMLKCIDSETVPVILSFSDDSIGNLKCDEKFFYLLSGKKSTRLNKNQEPWKWSKKDSVVFLLVKGPIPLTEAKKIIFKTEKDKEDFIAKIESSGGVNVKDLLDFEVNGELFETKSSISLSKTYFSELKQQSLPLEDNDKQQKAQPEDNDKQQKERKAQRYGAILSIIALMAHRSQLCASVYQHLWGITEQQDFNQEIINKDYGIKEFGILNSLPEQLSLPLNFKPKPKDNQVDAIFYNLYWDCVDTLLNNNSNKLPTDIVLELLEKKIKEYSADKATGKIGKSLEKFREHLKKIVSGSSSKSIIELYKDSKSSVSRALLLFTQFKGENVHEFLQYHNNELVDSDYLLAGILLTATSGYSHFDDMNNLPDELIRTVGRMMCRCIHSSSTEIIPPNMAPNGDLLWHEDPSIREQYRTALLKELDLPETYNKQEFEEKLKTTPFLSFKALNILKDIKSLLDKKSREESFNKLTPTARSYLASLKSDKSINILKELLKNEKSINNFTRVLNDDNCCEFLKVQYSNFDELKKLLNDPTSIEALREFLSKGNLDLKTLKSLLENKQPSSES